MKLGVDFGSTYSTLSRYDEKDDFVEALVLSETGTPYIPSVAAVDAKGKFYYGKLAKNKLSQNGVQIFEAFKMLLPETNENLLRSRGYIDYSPKEIARGFLDAQFKRAMKKVGDETIDKLVVCAPEVWNEKVGTLDGRTILREICREYPYVNDEDIQIVSEPAAASAFFAYNYGKINSKPYNGKMLLIDYGGGTLDITLTNVTPVSGGKSSVEIKVLARTGAGENQDGRIGSAGIAYMEGVAEAALREAQLIGAEEELVKDSKFLHMVNMFEQEVIERAEDIEYTFDTYGTKAAKLQKEEDDNLFATLDYGFESVDVTFSQMVTAYDEIIRPVLDNEINKIIAYMKDNKIVYDDPTRDDFKIEIVGGFGNYYLVKKQIDKIFAGIDLQSHKDGIKFKERAISLGAGLLAAGIISISNTAPYSIGVYCKGKDKEEIVNEFAIKYRDDLEFNRIYWQEQMPGVKRTFILMPGMLDSLIVGTGDFDNAFRLRFRDTFTKRIMQAKSDALALVALGFSFDSSGVVSLHVCDFDMAKGFMEDSAMEIELSSYSEMFELSTLESVVVRR